jgi:hypothetical protein
MKINIEIIPHAAQRYSTVGDWWVDPDGTLQIRVSKLSDPEFSALVALHEVVEVLIEGIKREGALAVPEELVRQTDGFDRAYEDRRAASDETSEPGYEYDCPVYQGHMVASAVEHLAAMVCGVNYNDYSEEITSLP